MKLEKKEGDFLICYQVRYARCKFIRNTLAGKGINRTGEGVIRSGYGNKSKMDF